LSTPPLFYVPADIIAARANLLRSFAADLLVSGTLPRDLLDYRPNKFQQIMEGYFLLNNAYKDWRLPDGHFTEKPKIAALQCVTISQFQPLFPLQHPVDDSNVSLIKCNEILAFGYAMGILEKSFTPDTDEKKDFYLRILDVITSTRAQTIEAYRVDRDMQIIRPLGEYTFDIHADDKPAINSLICIFELLAGKITPD
jgi:hypothetical protein